MVFRAVVFTFVPTIVELILVCFLLGRIFKPIIGIMVVATFAAYVFWTAQLTQAAAKVSEGQSAVSWLRFNYFLQS